MQIGCFKPRRVANRNLHRHHHGGQTSRSRHSLLRRYPIRKVTTPVPVEGGVEGGALAMSAGSSFHGRRKPNGSAFHRRIMAGVAISGAELTAEGGEQITIAGGDVTAAGEDLAISASFSNQISTFYPCPGHPS
jgi:hypothetical protein